MAGAGPGRQHEQHARTVRARQRVSLRGLEAQQAARPELDALRAGLDLNVAVDDDDPCVLLDLVLAERLSRFEHDQHRPRAFILVNHVRVPCSAWRVDRPQVPVLHGPDLDTPPALDSTAWSCRSIASSSIPATRRTAGSSIPTRTLGPS